MEKLFHVSEDPSIKIFFPRPVTSPDTGVTSEFVWAIDQEHLPNYLLPRDCPRVTFRSGDGMRVVAIEEGWLERVRNTQLFLYEFPVQGFELFDAVAGYYVAKLPVTRTRVEKLENLDTELINRQVDFRVLPSLWELRDSVVATEREYSIIRFRNAQPRP